MGADKGYDTRGFIAECRHLNVTPHVAMNTGRRGGSAIDQRTARHTGYEVSQKKRKRIEECFGWMKDIALMRKLKHRGLEKVGWLFTFAAAAYNLVRIRNLVTSNADGESLRSSVSARTDKAQKGSQAAERMAKSCATLTWVIIQRRLAHKINEKAAAISRTPFFRSLLGAKHVFLRLHSSDHHRFGVRSSILFDFRAECEKRHPRVRVAKSHADDAGQNRTAVLVFGLGSADEAAETGRN